MKIKKDNRDETLQICDELIELSNSSKSQSTMSFYYFNPIKEAEKILNMHIDKDYSILLKLKAELDIHLKFNENTFTQLAFIFSFFSTCVTFVMNIINIYDVLKDIKALNAIGMSAIVLNLVFFIFMCTFTLITYLYYDENVKRDKWFTYIKYALEDIEKDFEHKKTGL